MKFVVKMHDPRRFDEEQCLFSASHASFEVVFPTTHGKIFSDSEETRIESTC